MVLKCIVVFITMPYWFYLAKYFLFLIILLGELGVAWMVSNLISISSYWLVLSRKDEKCMIN